jgi:hypothetical protein
MISDSVAILNHGQQVAQAPIAELLSGNGEITYTLPCVVRPMPHAPASSASLRS